MCTNVHCRQRAEAIRRLILCIITRVKSTINSMREIGVCCGKFAFRADNLRFFQRCSRDQRTRIARDKCVPCFSVENARKIVASREREEISRIRSQDECRVNRDNVHRRRGSTPRANCISFAVSFISPAFIRARARADDKDRWDRENTQLPRCITIAYATGRDYQPPLCRLDRTRPHVQRDIR